MQQAINNAAQHFTSTCLSTQGICDLTPGSLCGWHNCHQRAFGLAEPYKYGYNCCNFTYAYVMRYLPIYTTELLFFLEESQVLGQYAHGALRVLSLGCGAGTDHYAILTHQAIYPACNPSTYTYYGIDKESSWANVQIPDQHAQYFQGDIFNTEIQQVISLYQPNLVFFNKIASALWLAGQVQRNAFQNFILNTLVPALPSGTNVVLNDVNHENLGRDNFDNWFSQCLSPQVRYRLKGYGTHYSHIDKDGLHSYFSGVQPQGNISFENSVRQTYFFHYIKP